MRNFACSLGFHKWDGCKCGRCGVTRNKNHDWGGCKCNCCAAIRNEGHNWDGPKCSLCGKPSPDEEARFVTAVADGDCEDVMARLEANRELACVTDSHNNTPLHLAIEYGHLPVARFLLTRHAYVGARNLSGNTPLHVAAEKDRAPLAQLLMEHGAEVCARNRRGDTPLLVAARHDSELVGALFVEAARDAALEGLNMTRKPTGRNMAGGVPSNWDGDRIVLGALNVAKMSGSHKMAACLHRANASFHRTKGELYTIRANKFLRLHNRGVAEHGQVSGVFKGFALGDASLAQCEYDMARQEDAAADMETALSVTTDESSASQ
jgi:hypothetical protein